MAATPKTILFVRIIRHLGQSFEIKASENAAPIPGETLFECTSGLPVLQEVLEKLRATLDTSPPAPSIMLMVDGNQIVRDPAWPPAAPRAAAVAKTKPKKPRPARAGKAKGKAAKPKPKKAGGKKGKGSK